MSSLVNISIDLTKIEKSRIVEGKNGAKYLDLTISINDEANDYGKNASVFHSQSKEEREQKQQKSYIGGGKVFWTDGNIVAVDSKPAQQKPKPKQAPEEELPF